MEHIPKIIHQTWKSANIPNQYLAWSSSWKRLHPGYEYRFWTDRDIDALIDDVFPEWKQIYENYHQRISRIDLARYLILFRYGGVYADLDEECIAPIDSLLENRQFVIGEEPRSHLNLGMAIRRNLTHLLCPTVIASVPKHPFWNHLFAWLLKSATEPGALDATGPFLLARAYSDYKGPPIDIVPSNCFYPFDKFQIMKGSNRNPHIYERSTRKSIGIHYWEGSWWRGGSSTRKQTDLTIDLLGSFDDTGLGRAAEGTALALEAAGFNVRRHRLFAKETAPRKHPFGPVILVHTNPDLLLLALNRGCPLATTALASDSLKIGLWAWEGLGTLRQEWKSVAHHFSEIWLPSRFCLEVCADQLPVSSRVMPHAVIAEQGTYSRQELGIPESAFCYLSIMDGLSNFDRKNPLGLLVAYQRAFPIVSDDQCLVLKIKNLTKIELRAIEEKRQGRSDIVLIDGFFTDDQIASLVETSDVYISLHRSEGFGLALAESMARGKPVIATGYSGNLDFMKSNNSLLVKNQLVRLQRSSGVYPAGTLWAEPNIESASSSILTVRYDQTLRTQVSRNAAYHLSMNFGPEAIGKRMKQRLEVLIEGRTYQAASKSKDVRHPFKTVVNGPLISLKQQHDSPQVLILTPMRNAAGNLPNYFKMLEALDYPVQLLSLGILEGDSNDDTFSQLHCIKDLYTQRFREIRIFQWHHGRVLHEPRWRPDIQRVRRSLIAQARNRLLSLALQDEDYVLWLDSDLETIPSNLLTQLLASHKDIVVPVCQKHDGTVFDKNTFIFQSDRNSAEKQNYLIDGIFQPPDGAGRIYLDKYQDETMHRIVPVDSVGGTALLVRADIHRQGVLFPAWPHRGYIETEGFAMIAKEMGVLCYGMPNLRIVHSDR